MLPLIVMLADADALLATARLRTRAEVPCEAPATPGEITVCGRRDADRYRVPFESNGLPDDAVFAERQALMRHPMQECGITGSALADCGYIGVGVSTNGRGVALRTRKLAD